MKHVFIGRFQLPHAAHFKIIGDALENEDDHLLIIIGSKNSPRTPKNPWSYDERVAMLTAGIREHFRESHKPWSDKPTPSIMDRVSFAPARDYLYNDYKWVSEVQSTVDRHFGDDRVTLHGCYKDDTSYYLDMFPRWKLDITPYLWKLDATELRTTVFERGVKALGPKPKHIPKSVLSMLATWHKSDWGSYISAEHDHYAKERAKWKDAPYTPTFHTADALVIKAGCILLVRRRTHPGKGLWALPGGFIKPDETIRQAALRELREETKIGVPNSVLDRAVIRHELFDHPHRSLRGRVITNAYLIDLGKSGQLPPVRGADDAELAEWVPIADFFGLESEMFEDHWHIIYQMIANY